MYVTQGRDVRGCFWLQWCLQFQCLDWTSLTANQQSHLSSLYSASRRCISLHCLLFWSQSSFSSRVCVLYSVLEEARRKCTYLCNYVWICCNLAHIFTLTVASLQGCRKIRKVWIRITVKYCSASSWSFSSFSWPPASCFSLENNQQSVNRCCWPTTHRADWLSSDSVTEHWEVFCFGLFGLTCVAPGSASPGSASCPAGD